MPKYEITYKKGNGILTKTIEADRFIVHPVTSDLLLETQNGDIDYTTIAEFHSNVWINVITIE